MPAFAQASSTVDCAAAVNIVKCVGGFVDDGNGSSSTTSCMDECDGDCCKNNDGGEENACEFFTGSVCKDGSCMGLSACKIAGNNNGFVGLIEETSCVGEKACYGAGNIGGHVNSIKYASCVGDSACYLAGSAGFIEQISGGCIGIQACHNLARAGGDITFVSNCCRSDQVCKAVQKDLDLPDECTAQDQDWLIDFNGLDTNFSISSYNEIALEYLFSQTREVQVDPLQMKGCEEEVSVDNPDLVHSSFTETDFNNTSKKLTITYDIDQSLLGNSSIYNATTKELNVCQRVKLVLKTGDSNMTIVEDVRKIEVDFDLDYNYTISDNTLAAATIKENETNTNVNNYIQAHKCNPDDNYASDDRALAPNTRLHLCIRSISSDVLIDTLDSMTATEQTFSENNIVIIENGDIKNPGITSWIYMDEMHPGPGPGVVVSTFLPISIFAYGGNSKVDITGTIAMKLVGSPDARRLQAANTDSVGTYADAASFDIKVDLQQNVASVEDSIVSPGMFVSNALSGLVLVFMPAYMMMW